MDDVPEFSGTPDEIIIQRAQDFLRRSSEAESLNRANALKWQKFRNGQQWDDADVLSRKTLRRACITINKTDAYCIQVENEQRKQRPRIKVDPTNGQASKQIATVIQGMLRHIENAKGGGDLAYDTGFSSAITIGRGFWRVRGDYVADDSFDQELFLEPIDNPLSCYGDPNSIMPDGSDQMEFLITDEMPKAEFKRLYPGKSLGQGFPADNAGPSWVTEHTIRIAEYFWIEMLPGTLHELSDGTAVWQLKGKEEGDDILTDEKVKELSAKGVTPTGETRKSFRRTVKYAKLTAMDVLEEATIPGKWIPVVPIYGKVVVIDGKREWSGIIKNAMDPQQMFNLYRSTTAEIISSAPKAKYIIAEGQDEGHEEEWATANTNATATLRYKQTDVTGQPAPPPERIQPEGVPEGAMEMAQSMSNDLTSVLGIVDPAMRIGGNVSGKALQSERSQADSGNYHYFDNMTRSIAFTGRILLSQFPEYYSEERVVRIVGEDGQADLAAINQLDGKNDVTVGQYDIVMDTGPGYTTRRQEALDGFSQLLDSPLGEEISKVGADLVVRLYDAPGMEVLADRLAASNPLSQIDDQSEIPPAVQMQIQAGKQQIQQLTQQVQQMEQIIKSRSDLKQMEIDGAMKRTLMTETTKAHDIEKSDETKRHDIQMRDDTKLQVVRETTATKRHDTEVRALTASEVAQIKAVADLLSKHIDGSHLMAEIAAEDRRTDEKAAEQEPETA